MDEGKKLLLLSYCIFICTFTLFSLLWVKAVLVNACGRDCQCDKLRRRWCSAVRSSLPVTCPDWMCLSLWAMSTVLDQWNWRREAEGWGRGREGWGACVWVGWQLCFLAWGAELTLFPSRCPLSNPSVAFKHSYAHACTNTQRQTLTCVHKYPGKSSYTHTQTCSLTHSFRS